MSSRKRKIEINTSDSANTVDESAEPKLKFRKPQGLVKKSRKKLKKEKEIVKLKEETFNKYKSGAVVYLETWKNNKSEWKFNKHTQYWIISNIYNEELLPNDLWTTILEYFQSSKGAVKTNLLENATKIVENEEETDETKAKRAREIVQNISE